MKRKKEIIKSLILGIVAIVLVAVLVELIGNFQVLKLEKNQKGQISLSKDVEAVNGFAKSRKGYRLEGEKGDITWNVKGTYVDKFSYDYDSYDLLDAKIKVEVINGFGKEEIIEIEDFNPRALSGSVVSIKQEVSTITLEIDGSLDNSDEKKEVTVWNPQIQNEVFINQYRIIVVVLLGIMLLMLWWCRAFVFTKIEYGFAIIALTLGLIMLISVPTNKIGWDEETHFGWAYRMSLLPGAELISKETEELMEVSIENWPYHQPKTYEEKENFDEMRNAYYAENKTEIIEGNTCGVRTPAFVFQALAMKLTRGLGGDFSSIFFVGRLAGLLLYVLLVSLAICVIPIGKRILTFIGLMPTSIFLAICYTYDIAVFGFITLGIALILREWLTEGRKVDWKCCAVASCCLVLGVLPKAVYAPVVLLGLAIPTSKYKNKKQAYIFRVILLGLFILLMLSFILPQLINPDAAADFRGGDVNPSLQMASIFSHPVTYTVVLLKNIFESLPEYVFGEATFRFMGHLQTAGFKYLIPIMLVFLILTDRPVKKMLPITIKQRLYLFFLIAMSVALIWTALYLSFVVPGSVHIGGVQGRYYRPLLLLLYLIIGCKGLQLNMGEKGYNAIVLAISGVIMGKTALEMFATFCL